MGLRGVGLAFAFVVPGCGSSRTASDTGVTPGGLFGDGPLVHGVKLQCVADPQNTMVCKMPLEYETHGLTYSEAVAQLARQGVPDVVVKICELNNQRKKTSSFDRTDRNQAIVKLLTAFADATDPTNDAYIAGYAPRLFLWERQWMWSNGALNMNDVAFAYDVSSLVVDAFDENVGRVLDASRSSKVSFRARRTCSTFRSKSPTASTSKLRR